MHERNQLEDRLIGSLLVALIHKPDCALPILQRLEPKHFSQEANRVLYTAVLALHHSGSCVDLVTIAAYLSQHNQLWQIGGRVRLADLWMSASEPEDLSALVEFVIQDRELP